MSDKPPSGIEITPQQWRDLHSRAFQDAILDKVWSRITWVFGTTSLIALVGIAGAIWGPLRKDITRDAIEDASRQVNGIASNLRSELTSRITGESERSLRAAAEAIARQEAEKQVRDGLGNETSDLHRQLITEIRRLLADGLVKEAMVAETARDFSNPGRTVEARAMSFRLLQSLDLLRARRELMAVLSARLAAAAAPAPTDRLLIEGLIALTDRPPVAGEPEVPPVQLAQVRDLAGLAVSVAEATRTPGDRISEDLVDATAGWLRSLGSAEEVADWLSARSLGARSQRGLHPAVWDLLLREGRRPALLRLGALLRTAPPGQVSAALRLLAESRWPELDPVEAERLLAVIEENVPDAALGYPGLTPSVLGARWALTQAATQGTAAMGFAWRAWGSLVRDAGVEAWRLPSEAHERANRAGAARRGSRGEAEGTPAALPAFPLGSAEDGVPWSVLFARLLGAVPESAAEAFIEALLPPLPASAGVEALRRRDRRLAVLALTLGRGAAASDVPTADPLTAATVLALAASPRLESSPLLGVALQRILSSAPAEPCAAAVPTYAGKVAAPNGAAAATQGGPAAGSPNAVLPAWPNIALLACASRGSTAALDRLAERLERTEPRDRPPLLDLWLLATPRAADFVWPAEDTPPARAGRLLEVLRSGGAALTPAMIRILGTMRPQAAEAIDAALERAAPVPLYPAPEDAPRGALPAWAFPAWWAEAGGPRRLVPPPERRSIEVPVPKDSPWRVAVDCAADRRTRLGLATGDGRSLLLLGQGQRARLVEGEATANLLAAEAGCSGERLILVRAPEGTMLTVSREAPVPPARFAASFAERGTAAPVEAGQPVALDLPQGGSAYFPLTLGRERRYVIRTSNLGAAVDTTLALLDARGETVLKDDDGGAEPNASRIEVDTADTPQIVALQAAIYNDAGGAFELEIEDLGPSEPAIALTLGAPLPLRLEPRQRAALSVALQAGRHYLLTTAELGPKVDTTLELRGPAGEAIGNDDDGGGELASRLAVVAPADGTYRILAVNIGESGPFTLLMREE